MHRLAAAAALTLVLGACGSPGGGGDETARQAVLAALSTTEDAGSARMSAEMSITAPEDADVPGFSDIRMVSEGVTDLDGHRGRMTMSFKGLPDAPGLEGLDDIEMIVDGTDVYMESSFLTTGLDDSKPWVRMDFSELLESGGGQFSQADPTQYLQYLQGISEGVEEVGREEIRGVTATRYDATVELSRMLEELPKGLRDQSKSAFERLGTDEFPMSVWIDDQGRLRRTFTEFDLSGAAEGAEGTKMTMTFDLFDFGIEFDLELPPENQVTDAPSGFFTTPTG